MDTLNDVFYVVGTDGHLSRWNEWLLEVTGYTDEKVADMQVVEFFPEDEQERIADAIEETLAAGEATVEAEFLTADGDRIPYEFTGARLTDPDGDLVGFVGFERDITERKEPETELRRTAARLEALFEHSPDMINVHDADGNLLDPNPRLCEKTGYDKGELDRSIEPDDAYTFWEGMEIGDRDKVEGIYQRRDGSTFPVEVHVQRLDLEGEDRFIAISRDISDRRSKNGCSSRNATDSELSTRRRSTRWSSPTTTASTSV